jgi:hypothetical protein
MLRRIYEAHAHTRVGPLRFRTMLPWSGDILWGLGIIKIRIVLDLRQEVNQKEENGASCQLFEHGCEFPWSQTLHCNSHFHQIVTHLILSACLQYVMVLPL